MNLLGMAIIPLAVMVLGLLLWGFSTEKLARIGEHMFVCGLLVTLLVCAERFVLLRGGR